MTSKILTMSAAALMAVAAAAPSRAQASGWAGSRPAYANGADSAGQFADPRRAAYDNGYRDGVRRGEEAARGRRPLDIERERDYRYAEDGYNRNLGDPNRYHDEFRRGFAAGYRDGFNRNAANRGGIYDGRREGVPVPNGGGYAINIAFQNGVNDGYLKGLDDVRHGRYADVARQKWYRNGDHNYNGRFGSRDVYRNEYRHGFQDGYNRAYGERRY